MGLQGGLGGCTTNEARSDEGSGDDRTLTHARARRADDAAQGWAHGSPSHGPHHAHRRRSACRWRTTQARAHAPRCDGRSHRPRHILEGDEMTTIFMVAGVVAVLAVVVWLYKRHYDDDGGVL